MSAAAEVPCGPPRGGRSTRRRRPRRAWAALALALVLAGGFAGGFTGPAAGRQAVQWQWCVLAVLALTVLLASGLAAACVVGREGAGSSSRFLISSGGACVEPSSPSSSDGSKLPAEASEVRRRSVELVRRSQLPITAVETLTAQSWEKFSTSETCSNFARLKHGDSEMLRQASHALAMTIRAHPLAGLWLAAAPQDVCVIAPAYRVVPTAGSFMAIEIHKELCVMGGGKPVNLFQMKRRSITNGDFATMDMKTRKAALANQFYRRLRCV
ncbi:unnamed protein product [Prorocentrum cordatum]|uniref:Uncharacterized protein n=1 Tax=Prorocentrum cordatum TaxID=2364126 RepID=A0ABN9RXL7_9DINO|nr:unnamed protein product [Polarella glacialis]